MSREKSRLIIPAKGFFSGSARGEEEKEGAKARSQYSGVDKEKEKWVVRGRGEASWVTVDEVAVLEGEREGAPSAQTRQGGKRPRHFCRPGGGKGGRGTLRIAGKVKEAGYLCVSEREKKEGGAIHAFVLLYLAGEEAEKNAPAARPTRST